MAKAASFRAEGRPIVDLTDTNFHRQGIRYPDSRLRAYFSEYVDRRGYRSESLGMRYTRDRLSEWYRSEGELIDSERVILTASTSESYSLVFQSLFSSGDRVLLPVPTYPLFDQLCDYARLEPVYYRLRPENGFAPDFDDVVEGFEAGARAVVIISPNNPTGAVLSTSALARFDRLAASYGALVVSDEVFVGTERERCGISAGGPPAAREAGRLRFGGVSKLFASPDVKLAWIVSSGIDNSRFDALELAADTYLNASAPSQYVTARMLEEGRDVVGEIREVLSHRAATVDAVLSRAAGPCADGLQEHSVRNRPPLVWYRQAGGVHRVLQIPGADDEKLAIDLLEREGVLVHPGYFYGFPDDGFFVISTVARGEVLTEGLERIERFLLASGSVK